MPHAPPTTPPSQASRHVVFFGGALSALLLRLTHAPYDHRYLAWLALAPFLFSLIRNPNRPVVRLVHGLTLGLILIPWELSWFFKAARESLEPSGFGSIWTAIGASFLTLSSWLAIALSWTLFAVSAGVLLRGTSLIFPLCGLPTLWTGIEILRCHGVSSPWLAPWETLAYTLAPTSNVAQVARWIGVHGLSWFMVFSATALALCIRQPSWRKQLWLAFLAGVFPLAAQYALPSAGPDASASAVRVGQVAQGVAGQPLATEELAAIGGSLARAKPGLVFWPGLASMEPAANGDARNEARDPPPRPSGIVARQIGIPVLTNAEAQQASVIVLADASGRLIASSARNNTSWILDGVSRDAGHGLIDAPEGPIGVGQGAEFLTSRFSRAATIAGARALFCISRVPAEWGYDDFLLWTHIHAFRAIENGRWVLIAGRGGAFAINPRGAPKLQLLPGFDSAGVAQVEYCTAQTFYTRWGDWLEWSCAGAAALIIVLAAVRRRRNDKA